MLVHNLQARGNKLLMIRKKRGLTQMEVAEAAGLADRTYADIERGSVNMRIETIMKICDALHITPNEVLIKEDVTIAAKQDELIERLNACSFRDRETALNLLAVFLQSLDR